MASKDLTKAAVISAIRKFLQEGANDASSTDLLPHVNMSPATLKRYLDELVTSGQLVRTGKARSTRYRLPKTQVPFGTITADTSIKGTSTFPMSDNSRALFTALSQPLASRFPVTYQRHFIDQYIPNETFLLPKDLAQSLANEGRMRGQQPAGTYARKVLEQLLIDLSWSSSRLEGNRFTLLATEELFKRGLEGGDADAIMLLNHKRAIEFLVDAVPESGLTDSLIRNLHALLMQDLLSDPRGLGEIRTKIVNISDTVYVPSQVPTLLEEILGRIIERARQIKNPIEAAFFLWINIAYLQPFEDGNKRTSRLAANIPLMIYNCAPLSFLDVNAQDYAYAMMGIYESLDVSLAVDLFTWTYRRSLQKFAVIMESMCAPDPFRLKYREQLSAAVQLVVCEGQKSALAIHTLHVSQDDKTRFATMLREELSLLTVHNCARHRVTVKTVERWIAIGRPS